MKIKKESNQYYGRYIERGVSDLSYGKPIQNYEHFNFGDDEDIMKADIVRIYQYINKPNINYIGNHTANESGDLEADGVIYELKYTDGSNGTYYNTSVQYINQLGFKDYVSYLKDNGYYNWLESVGVENIKYNNASPVSIEQSKIVRHTQPELYKKIQKYESELRKSYVLELFNYLVHNETIRVKFVNDMICKAPCQKDMPDCLIIFDHETKRITQLDKTNIQNLGINNNNIRIAGDYSIVISKVKATFAWQNGTGLNNPTIRIFLEV